MKMTRRLFSMFLGISMVLSIAAPAMAQNDGGLDSDVYAFIVYPTSRTNYVSLDTTEGQSAKSEWFDINTSGNSVIVGTPAIKSAVRYSGGDPADSVADTDLLLAVALQSPVLQRKGSDDEFSRYNSRFVTAQGRTPNPGIYLVTIDFTLRDENDNTGTSDVIIPIEIELHISAGDPSYVKQREITFNNVDLSKAATELISDPIQIKNPVTGANLTGAEGSFYTLNNMDGNYNLLTDFSVVNAANGAFQIKVTPGADGKISLPYSVYFRLRGRMVYDPIELPVTVTAKDPTNYYDIRYTKDLVISDDYDQYSTKVEPVAKNAGESVPDGNMDIIFTQNGTGENPLFGCIPYNDYAIIQAENAGDGVFTAQFTASPFSNSYFNFDKVMFTFPGLPISATGATTPDPIDRFEDISQPVKIDLNNLNDYEFSVGYRIFDDLGNQLTPTGMKLSAYNSDNDFFEIVPGSITTDETTKTITCKVKLQNIDREFSQMDYYPSFDVLADGQTVYADKFVETFTTPPTFAFRKYGTTEEITSDIPLPLEKSMKVDLFMQNMDLDNFQLSQFVFPEVSSTGLLAQPLSFVRGENQWAIDGNAATETITLRYDQKADPSVEYITVETSASYKPEITNPAVKLTASEYASLNIFASFNIIPGEPEPDPDPDPNPNPNPNPGGGGGGGGGGATGTSTVLSINRAASTSAVNSALTKAINDAVKNGRKTAVVTLKNISSISPNLIKLINDRLAKAGLTGVVVIENKGYSLRFNPADFTLTTDLKTELTINDKSVLNRYTRLFSNQTQNVKFAHKGSFGMEVTVTLKTSFAAANAKNLILYNYTPTTGKAVPYAKSNITAHTDGTWSFTTNMGDCPVLSNGALQRK